MYPLVDRHFAADSARLFFPAAKRLSPQTTLLRRRRSFESLEKLLCPAFAIGCAEHQDIALIEIIVVGIASRDTQSRCSRILRPGEHELLARQAAYNAPGPPTRGI
jgi:hypothetical protein